MDIKDIAEVGNLAEAAYELKNGSIIGSPNTNNSKNPWWAIPLSILLAGLIIAGAILYQERSAPSKELTPKDVAFEEIIKIQKDDHIYGNPDADLFLIEYSDTECPYCKGFHPELKKAMDQLAPSGKVAWVYRHFPFHTNAPKEAQATECVAELYDNATYWKYLNELFAAKTPNGLFADRTLDSVATAIGIDSKLVADCVKSGRQKNRVDRDLLLAKKAGVDGTPTVFYVYKGELQTIQPGIMSAKTVTDIVNSIIPAK